MSAMSRLAHARIRLAQILLVSLLVTGCASSQAVPRPFPGAALPPAAGEPPAAAGSAPAAAVGTAPEPAAPITTPEDGSSAGVRPAWTSELLASALALRGTPYRNGGTDLKGFDCSGFVRYVFAQVGQQLPREVRDQFAVGTPVKREEVQPGDLVFFQTVSPGASHVGIALGNDEFVHAPSSRGVVRTERYTVTYWSTRWVGARRIG
jgi:cell wall-associated NlpC family hydrolase